jgi:hypothetical protein
VVTGLGAFDAGGVRGLMVSVEWSGKAVDEAAAGVNSLGGLFLLLFRGGGGLTSSASSSYTLVGVREFVTGSRGL